jgi:nucleoside-diphosphate-sugar epimerase
VKIVVTGSDGFIGRHVVDRLRDDGHRTIGLDIRSGTDCSASHAVLMVERLKADVIVHLAATCSTPGSLARPLETYRNTVTTAVNMAEAARMSGAKFLLTSSVKARDGRTPYGAAKRMAEGWASEYAASYGLPVVINRPGTVYGPGQEGSPESGWIAWFLKARNEGLPVTINGNGRQIRDLLHVSDYASLISTQVADFDTYRGGLFDVGGGEANAVTVNDMASHLGLVTSHGPTREGDARSYIGLNLVPGWKPTTDWRSAIV